MTFSADGTYLEAMICYRSDTSQSGTADAAQVNKGTFYVVDGTSLTVVIDQSSCDTNNSGSSDFSVFGNTLYISPAAGGMLMMNRLGIAPGEPQSTDTMGCFDPNTWAFTPMEVHSI